MEMAARDPIPWKDWKRRLVSPSDLQQQMDSWSCGLFVILVMSLLASGETPAYAVNNLIPEVHQDTPKLLLNETRYTFASLYRLKH